MKTPLLARTLLAASLLLAVSACGSTSSDPLVGTYLATTFLITPPNQGTTNVLAQGGSLGINIANNYVTAGTLILPASLNGGVILTTSLAGTATITGSAVTFTTLAPTFFRQLTFTLATDSLTANQTVADTTFDIVLRRQ
jgi:hypothetical protein